MFSPHKASAGHGADSRRSFPILRALCWALGIFCLAAFQTPLARAASELTLDELLADVTKRSPELASRRAEVRAASERPAQARAFDDPMLMVELWQVPIGLERVPLMITLRQPIPWPGKLRARAAVMESDVTRAQAEEATTTRNLLLEAARAYFDYRRVVRSIDVLHQTERLLAAIVIAIDARYRVGRADLAELLKAQADAATLSNLLLDAERERDVTVTAMNVLLARPADSTLGLPVTAAVLRQIPTLDALTDQALAQRAELRGVRAALAQAQARELAARTERAPDLAVWGGFMAMLRGGNDHAFTVGIQTSIPSFSLTRSYAAEREAKAQASAQRSMQTQTEARIRGEVRQALLRLETTERHIRLHEKTLLPTAERAVQAAQAGYQSGRVSIVLLLDTARAQAEHRLEYERVLAEYGQRLAEIEAVIGGPLHTGSLFSRAEVPSPRLGAHP